MAEQMVEEAAYLMVTRKPKKQRGRGWVPISPSRP
jgi:hypothetical protein